MYKIDMMLLRKRIIKVQRKVHSELNMEKQGTNKALENEMFDLLYDQNIMRNG